MTRGKDEVDGPRGRMNLDTKVGEFEPPNYRFVRAAPDQDGASLWARRNQRSAPKPLCRCGPCRSPRNAWRKSTFHLHNASYTTCDAPNPVQVFALSVDSSILDYDRERGEGTNATLHFKDVPIAYVPWMDFPLNGSRQSGLLPATFGRTPRATGLDLTVPYYLNLAPNYDATIAPRWMRSDRGLQLGSEFYSLSGAGRHWQIDRRVSGSR